MHASEAAEMTAQLNATSDIKDKHTINILIEFEFPQTFINSIE